MEIASIAIACLVIGVLLYSLYSLTLNVSAIRQLLEEAAARERSSAPGSAPRGSS